MSRPSSFALPLPHPFAGLLKQLRPQADGHIQGVVEHLERKDANAGRKIRDLA